MSVHADDVNWTKPDIPSAVFDDSKISARTHARTQNSASAKPLQKKTNLSYVWKIFYIAVQNNMQGVHVKVNTELLWQKQLSTRRKIFSPANWT
jgi:hypothetical protein